MANKIKGITLEIRGDTTLLSKELDGVNKHSRDLKSELREVEKLLKLDPNNTEILAQKQKILAESVENTKTKLDTLKEAEKQVKNQFEQGQIGEENYRAVQREVKSAEEELKKLESSLKSVNSTWDDAAKKIDKFGNSAKSAGEKFAPISAVAGAAAGGMVAVAIKAGMAADDINTLSKQTGLSTDTLQKFAYASDQIDVSSETLGGSLKKLTKSMSDAKDGTKQTVEAFEELGVKFKDDLTGELRNNEDVFYDLVDALGKIENETERDALAMELFGKSATDLNPLILGGANALKELGKEAEEAGLILSQDALDGANAFNDELDNLKATAKATFLEMGADLAKGLTPALKDMADALKGVMAWVRSLSPETLKFILIILSLIAAITPILLIVGKLATAVSAIMGLVSSLGALMGGVGAAGGVAAGGVSAMGATLTAVAAPIALIVAGVIGLIAIIKNLWENNEEFRDKVTEIWASVQDLITQAIEAIKDILTFFAKFFKDIWELIKVDATKIIDGMWKVILGIIDGAIQVIKGLLTFFTGLFTGDFTKMKEGVILIFKGIWTALSGIISGAWNIVSGSFGVLLGSITGWFGGLATSALQWGKNMIGGFIDGIKSMASSVSDAVSGVIGGVKDFIGFNSPAKKGEGKNIVKWGRNMVSGFVDGIKDGLGYLDEVMASAISTPEFSVNNDGTINHKFSGTIRVEGVSNDGEFKSATEIVLDEIRRQSRQ